MTDMSRESGKEAEVTDKIERHARKLLDDDVAATDGATASRLHRMRSEAVARRQQRAAWISWTGAGAAAAGVAAVALYFNVTEPDPLPAIYEDPVQQAAASEMELMDDLDFVAWLVMQEGENTDASDQT
jgi:methyl coenzyme M reductase beta subunit